MAIFAEGQTDMHSKRFRQEIRRQAASVCQRVEDNVFHLR